TRPAPEGHSSGAGDVFAAALTVSLAARLRLPDAMRFAQEAADISVRAPGTCVCSITDLLAVAHPGPRVYVRTELREKITELRAAGKRIVFTNGCFDVLHRGHTSYLREAKNLGDVLVVGLNSDASIRR